MKEHIVTIQQNPYFGFIISIIAIASIIYAIYVNQSSKKYKFLEHYELSNTLFYPSRRKKASLHLYYDDKEILNATVTNIAIWNAGNEAIRSTDLANSITLLFDDEENVRNDDKEYVNSILDANIVGVTNQKNEVAIIDQDMHKVTIGMKFLNPKDGFVVQLLHTGFPFNLKVDIDVIGENKRKIRVINKRKHWIKSWGYERLKLLLKRAEKYLCFFTTLLFVLWNGARVFYPRILGNDQADIRITSILFIFLLIVVWGSYFITRTTDYYDLVPDDIKSLLKE